jgi:hypothetical protein
MPGPGQGKRTHKKKWRKNASKSIAVHPVTTTATATTTSPEEPAANGTNNTTCVVDTATAVSPTNDTTMQPLTYSHNEVRLLLENARNEGKAEGFNEGYEVGLQDGMLKDEDIFKKFREEEEKEAREAAFVNGRKEGKESRRLKERKSWKTHHGTKCCISVQNHIHELWRGTVVAMHPGVHCSQVMCRLGLCHMTMLISICGRQSRTSFDPCVATTSVCVCEPVRVIPCAIC